VITTTATVIRQTWQDGHSTSSADTVVAETPVALVYNGVSHVVTMATPIHLEEMALGFSLSEGILHSAEQLLDCEVQQQGQGFTVNMTITAEPFVKLKQRRRNLTGRTGCGLCGVESLEQAIAPVAKVTGDVRVSHASINRAVIALSSTQSLKATTGGVHGAAWCTADGRITVLREDVGRHNALDKLLGALQMMPGNEPGFVLVTSRASYEMVAKVAACNRPLLAAVSAPTALAISLAEQAGVTLLGFVQPQRQVIYTHPYRVSGHDTAEASTVERD
tara:strand:- start:59891 stop:60721 length:831 start_codon:yes stop_codon:yes gene_type:complete